jgi:NADPH2:quinone reductase
MRRWAIRADRAIAIRQGPHVKSPFVIRHSSFVYTLPMRAIRVSAFGNPDVLTLEETPVPEPAPGEVRVRLHAAGVNPYESYIRTGNYARLPQLPYTPGSDGAGIVDAVGPDVSGHAVGDRVYVAAFGGGTGTYAEQIVCAAAHVHPLPDDVGFGQGAALGVPAATAYRALTIRARARAGETVLVHGASGAVGVASAQLARAAGLRVFGTAGSDEGLALATRAGCERVFNHRSNGYEKSILEATGGHGVDLILEMLANENLLRDLGLLKQNGRVVVIGSRGRIEIDPRLTMGKESAVLGTTLWSTTSAEYVETHAALAAALDSGVLRPAVGRELPLGEAAEAHRAVIEDRAAGKIVLVMD